jgi:hypothetical protein
MCCKMRKWLPCFGVFLTATGTVNFLYSAPAVSGTRYRREGGCSLVGLVMVLWKLIY